ncbi:MAG: ABC transporter substrate-binding protein [Candidatus Woesearchaeota archaeon]|jgi:NitT/TauT family transport system substrate-binding protein|nr:ABC transporter substrate-binding protein [Candidatus Woesearchaeota archaeon]MDP7199217.1 ABC transporter substrate-binding protein [Candidatus Woesearchaeota archaeon]MDP7467830.1 ABC transporter substrate-binding protein [Candidatus Woesearchaeota archaeon]MDP7647820.1 ABC transporter substrate-binding protein [Candidatus Woesearchaeota archaeon]|tara:strand:- start:1058 stop:2026 length:969 start_codon:yes stop_codon:yes gene_type:complete
MKRIIITFALLAMLGCGATPDGLTELNIRMPIPVIESHAAPFIAAQKMGFYEEEGLKVNINPSSAQLNPVTAVLSGADEIAWLGGPDTMLVAQGKGADLIAIANVYQESNFVGIMTLKDSGIKTVKDLEGKRLGMFFGHISTDIIRAWLKQEGVTVEEVNVVFDFQQLIRGDIDAMFDFRTYGPLIMEHKLNHSVHRMEPKDYGIRSWGYTLFAKRSFTQEHPEVVEGYIRATMKGLKWSRENTEEAITMIIGVNPGLNADFERIVRGMLADIYDEQYGDGRPLGWLDPHAFKETYERLDRQGLIEEPFDYTKSYTNAFVEA